MSNETAIQWLEKHHPAIHKVYLEYLAEKRRARSREYQKNLHKLAKSAAVAKN